VRLADICIERPVLTLMMTLSLIVFGVMGYSQLGVDQFPNMEFPVVSVTAVLEGAAPEVMEEDVTEVLEEQINTIAGLRTLRSTTYHGVSTIEAEFDLEVEIDQAAQDVRDKIALARRMLPPDLEPPVVSKMNTDARPIMWIPLNSDRPAVDTTEYLKHTLKPIMETIPGVGGAEVFGRREREIRIWVDGEALRARGLSTSDVVAALHAEHVDIPGGRVESQWIEYSLKTDSEFETVAELEDLIIAHAGGAPVRLRDVARVEDGAEDLRIMARVNGELGGGLGIMKQTQGNTVAISDHAHARLDALRGTLPTGMELPSAESVFDFSYSIRESVAETQFALILGAILATLTVLAFLRRASPTLIVALAIPISLVTSFGFIWLAGHTINIMTLLALTLAVGVVIDDAIVVLENIDRHRALGEGPREAASNGTRQIAFAATAATVSIAVVFLPVVFVRGIVGNFLGAFGVTVAAAVMVSLFVALTLTPMLAARMPPPRERAHGSVYHRLEQAMTWSEDRYRALLGWALAHRAAVLGIALASFVAALAFGSQLSAEFMPPSDEGRFFILMETPPGTSFEGTLQRVNAAERWVLELPELEAVVAGIGTAGGNRPGLVTSAMMVVMLTSHEQRERTAFEIIKSMRGHLETIPGLTFMIFDPSSFTGAGSADGEFEFRIRGNLELAQLDALSDEFIRALERRPGFVDFNKSLKVGLPEVSVVPDRGKAAALGVQARAIAEVVQASIGGIDVATFKEGGHRYDVRMRLEAEDRADPGAIGELYVRTKGGDVIELRNVTRIETGAAPSAISRVDRQRSVTVSANLEDLAVGDAITTVREIANDLLPEGATVSFAGRAEAFVESISQFGLAIGLAVLVIYMVLAAQFESLVHPLTVMLALPLAMVGALGALFAFGMTINLFSLIGIILLFGLVTKNSILLVDFANQLRAEGMPKVEAMRTAAPVRMRPVLMTAISMIFGVLPAAIGVGPGAESRQPMAVATAAGMFSSTLLTLLVVPVFYLVLDDAVDWVRGQVRGVRRRTAVRPV
jgi:HAE1 family hydrophobic/amphiphilic exporter-1